MAIELLDPKNELFDGMPLWRYMKVSTFFLLLEGKAFIPTVETLRRGDPLEGGLGPESPWTISKLSSGGKEAYEELETWLLNHALSHERIDPSPDFFAAKNNSSLLARIYARELAKRRSVWCWFNSSIESAAMWSTYGPNGLAIKTSLTGLKRALPETRDFQIAKLEYIDRRACSPKRFNPEAAHSEPRILRPHLLKAIEYENEQEVRVTTRCPIGEPGVMLRGLEPNELVQQIIFSPLMPEAEAKALSRWIEKFPWKRVPEMQGSCLAGLEAADLSGETLSDAFDEYDFPDVEKLPPLVATL